MTRRAGASSLALMGQFSVLAVFAVLAGCGGGDERVSFPDRCAGDPRPYVEWSRCNLIGVDLTGADMSGALIHDVVIDGANLTGANLTGAVFVRVYADEKTILRDVNLSGATVSAGDIQKAVFCNTTMPDGKIANGGC